jgi:hypothetical protein
MHMYGPRYVDNRTGNRSTYSAVQFVRHMGFSYSSLFVLQKPGCLQGRGRQPAKPVSGYLESSEKRTKIEVHGREP